MASLRDIRNRINSVRNTQQVTRAMKMVAAAKLRQGAGADLQHAALCIHGAWTDHPSEDSGRSDIASAL
jgi:hypothetical protein